MRLSKSISTVFTFATSSSTFQVISPLKLSIIKQSLPLIHRYGWSDTAIQAACIELGYSTAMHRVIRPYDLITYCMRKWNAQALRKVDDSNFEGKTKIREKVFVAIKTRL